MKLEGLGYRHHD